MNQTSPSSPQPTLFAGDDQAPAKGADYSTLIHYGRLLVKEYNNIDGRRERTKKQEVLAKIQHNIGRWKRIMYGTS